MSERKAMLTTAEAAEFLGFKVSYLHKLMMRRVVPFYKPNGKLCFFDPDELDQWRRNIRISTVDEVDRMAQNYILTKNLK